MTDAFASSHVSHFGRANRDYICTKRNGTTFTLPKDTKVVIVDLNLSRDKFVIWWERNDFYARLTISAARSLIITLPERRWTTENTQGRKLSVVGHVLANDKRNKSMTYADVQTVDKYGKGIAYGEEHHGYITRMSTDGMSFLVNILHGPDIGRKGVRIPVRHGFVVKDEFADESRFWMFKRLTFVKDYTSFDSNGIAVHTFKKGDRSCIVHGVDAVALLLRVRSSSVEDSQRVMRVDITAHAVEADTDCDGVYHFNTRNGPVTVESGGWWCDPESYRRTSPDGMYSDEEELWITGYKISVPSTPPNEILSLSSLKMGAQW